MNDSTHCKKSHSWETTVVNLYKRTTPVSQLKQGEQTLRVKI